MLYLTDFKPNVLFWYQCHGQARLFIQPMDHGRAYTTLFQNSQLVGACSKYAFKFCFKFKTPCAVICVVYWQRQVLWLCVKTNDLSQCFVVSLLVSTSDPLCLIAVAKMPCNTSGSTIKLGCYFYFQAHWIFTGKNKPRNKSGVVEQAKSLNQEVASLKPTVTTLPVSIPILTPPVALAS